jgi:amino acid permease
MMKANVGLGVLSIPYVYQVLGIVPGTIVIVLIQSMVTWSDWVVSEEPEWSDRPGRPVQDQPP